MGSQLDPSSVGIELRLLYANSSRRRCRVCQSAEVPLLRDCGRVLSSFAHLRRGGRQLRNDAAEGSPRWLDPRAGVR
jgi:hypothetical protein